jgi:predicted ABC-type ATPase
MTSATPRLRMFAGPNGSGKSTIKAVIGPELLGVYLNPDEIEKDIRRDDFLDLRHYGVQCTAEEILAFFHGSSLLKQAELEDEAAELRFDDGKLSFHSVSVNAYFASVAADFLRQKLLVQRASFTLETVMSSPDKVALLEQAQRLGYQTYLYYIATDDPIINVSRVKSRVRRGGHPVPEDKIISRYARSLDLLMAAIRHTNRAYVFDNSNHERVFLAEITDGKVVEMKGSTVTAWFKKAVLDKATSGTEPS